MCRTYSTRAVGTAEGLERGVEIATNKAELAIEIERGTIATRVGDEGCANIGIGEAPIEIGPTSFEVDPTPRGARIHDLQASRTSGLTRRRSNFWHRRRCRCA